MPVCSPVYPCYIYHIPSRSPCRCRAGRCTSWSRTSLIRDDELGLTLVCSVYRHHAEIEQQAEEVVWVVDSLGREVLVERAYHESLGYQLLDDAGIVGELLVVADEHSQLVIVDTDVGLYHGVGDVVLIIYIVANEIEYHHGVVHRGLAIALDGKAIV